MQTIRQAADRLDYVTEHGCFTPEKNREIYARNYEHPRHRMFAVLSTRLGLRDKVLCDAGCGYGANLTLCHPDSYGIDISDLAVKFCNSLGLNVHKHDIVEDDLSALPRVDVLWNSSTIEHVDSPHIFLRKLQTLIKPGGMMVLDVPYTGSYAYGRVGLPYPAKQCGDHINAFTPTTMRFFAERAGFETQSVQRWSSKLLKYAEDLPLWAHRAVPFAPFSDRILYIGTKPVDWEYPKKARRRVANTPKGFKPR